MTAAEFDALVDTLPNGLHDAELVTLAVDLVAATVVCLVNVDLSDPANPADDSLDSRAHPPGKVLRPPHTQLRRRNCVITSSALYS